MTLALSQVSKIVGGEAHLSDISLALQPGSLNILLGPTLSGKTSIMRIMAGLDKPTSGTVTMDGTDVTRIPVRQRDVAMVYQQFINYPTLKVYDNIASPLKVAGMARDEIDRRVRATAERLKMDNLLDRTPLELSGGQQQRTALARALAKEAQLVLLDEPLANLDYKLREELRADLPRIFEGSGAIFVYATTEPEEALLLGGRTATLHQGTVTRFGTTLDVFRNPGDLKTARVFSDPPANTLDVEVKNGKFRHGERLEAPVAGPLKDVPAGQYTLGFRAPHLYLSRPHSEAVAVRAIVRVAELTGSESFVHVDFGDVRWVAVAHGIHDFPVDTEVDVYLDPYRFLVFDPAGRQVAGPHMAAAEVA